MTAVDLDALEAEALATAPAGVPFSYRGVEFTVPPAKCWPLSVQRRLAHGDVDALDEVLSGTTFEGLANAGLTQAGFEALLDRLQKMAGGPPLPRSSAPFS